MATALLKHKVRKILSPFGDGCHLLVLLKISLWDQDLEKQCCCQDLFSISKALGLRVSRPRPRPRLRPGQNELESTGVSRPWSRDHNTVEKWSWVVSSENKTRYRDIIVRMREQEVNFSTRNRVTRCSHLPTLVSDTIKTQSKTLKFYFWNCTLWYKCKCNLRQKKIQSAKVGRGAFARPIRIRHWLQ